MLGDEVVPESDLGAFYAKRNLCVRHIVCVADFMFNKVPETLMSESFANDWRMGLI